MTVGGGGDGWEAASCSRTSNGPFGSHVNRRTTTLGFARIADAERFLSGQQDTHSHRPPCTTYATMMLRAAVPPAEVARRLGHSVAVPIRTRKTTVEGRWCVGGGVVGGAR